MKKLFIISLSFLLLVALAGCNLGDREVQMIVYLDEDLTDIEARSIGTKLAALSDAIRVEYVPAESALESFTDMHKDNSAFADIDTGTLRDRYIITAKESDTKNLTRQISDIEGVDEVKIVI